MTTGQAIIKRKGYPQKVRTFELKKDAEKWARQEERAMDAGTWRILPAARKLRAKGFPGSASKVEAAVSQWERHADAIHHLVNHRPKGKADLKRAQIMLEGMWEDAYKIMTDMRHEALPGVL